MISKQLSASSHPAALAVSFHYSRDGMTVNLDLDKRDIEFLETIFAQVREQFLPWIAPNFECVDDRTWKCKYCVAVINGTQELGGACVQMYEHLLDVHGRTITKDPWDHRKDTTK